MEMVESRNGLGSKGPYSPSLTDLHSYWIALPRAPSEMQEYNAVHWSFLILTNFSRFCIQTVGPSKPRIGQQRVRGSCQAPGIMRVRCCPTPKLPFSGAEGQCAAARALPLLPDSVSCSWRCAMLATAWQTIRSAACYESPLSSAKSCCNPFV